MRDRRQQANNIEHTAMAATEARARRDTVRVCMSVTVSQCHRLLCSLLDESHGTTATDMCTPLVTPLATSSASRRD